MLDKTINIAWFQAGWFGSILLGNLAAAVISVLTGLLYGLVRPIALREWLFIGSVLLMGIAHDSLLALIGVLQLPGNGWFPPLWMISLWLLFATTLNQSLVSFVRHPAFPLLCALFAPFSYLAGVKLSEAAFGFATMPAMAAVASGWFLVGILIRRIHRQILEQET